VTARLHTVLGIDPGTASTGYGVIASDGARLSAVCGGVIATKPQTPLEQRLAAIFRELDGLMTEHRPTAVAVEDIFFGRNVRTAFAVGQARGVVLGVAGLRDVPCFTYTPQAIKLSVCGAGGAGKGQVQRMVAALLGLDAPPEPDHVADALAVAICHASQRTELGLGRRPPPSGESQTHDRLRRREGGRALS
jgi:crossover junction endodeoxyribonuclease RuvC